MSEATERTLVLIKPDAMIRELGNPIQEMIRQAGLTVVTRKLYSPYPERELVESHYEEHRGREYFNALVDFMVSGPVLALVVSGPDAINRFRVLLGDKTYSMAAAGTIRRKFGRPEATAQETVAHGSDGTTTAERELKLWFPETA